MNRMNSIHDVFDRLMNFGTMLRAEGDLVRINIALHHYELQLRPGHRSDQDGVMRIKMDLVNANTGKSVRGFAITTHPWWLRKFVYALAAGVAYTEREWQTLPQEYVDMMEAQEKEK